MYVGSLPVKKKVHNIDLGTDKIHVATPVAIHKNFQSPRLHTGILSRDRQDKPGKQRCNDHLSHGTTIKISNEQFNAGSKKIHNH